MNAHDVLLELFATRHCMIKNFSDHAANERTFLAWVRTAITVMAFGFLVEKFDLFLSLAGPSFVGRRLSVPGEKFGNIAGLSLIVTGTLMVTVATWRYVKTERDLRKDAAAEPPSLAPNLILAGLMIVLGIAMFLYLSHALTPLAATPAHS